MWHAKQFFAPPVMVLLVNRARPNLKLQFHVSKLVRVGQTLT